MSSFIVTSNLQMNLRSLNFNAFIRNAISEILLRLVQCDVYYSLGELFFISFARTLLTAVLPATYLTNTAPILST